MYNIEILNQEIQKKIPNTDFELFESIDSTNNYLKNYYKNALRDKIVIAKEQTNGKGRHDRKWISPKNKQLILSIGYKSEIETKNKNLLGWIPLITAISLVNILWEKYRIKAEMKWPNDVQINGKKISGILIERALNIKKEEVFIIGLGLNVFEGEYTKILDNAISIEEIADSFYKIDINDLALALIFEITKNISLFYKGTSFKDEYSSKSSTIGKEVIIYLDNKETVSGVATAISDEGYLQILNKISGEIDIFSAGEVMHLRKKNKGYIEEFEL